MATLGVPYSPYTGQDVAIRQNIIPGNPDGASIFSSNGNNLNAFGFIQGILRPAPTETEYQDAGLNPSVLNYNFNAGDSTTGPVNVTQFERELVGKYPDFFEKLKNVMSKPWSILIWVGVFFVVRFALKSVWK